MKQTLQLRLGQQLTMTPQLQQAIRLLQLSTLDLQQEIQQVLDTNMMLEVAEDESTSEDNGPQHDSDHDDRNSETDQPEVTSEGSQTDIPDELPVDSNWDDVYENVQSSNSTSSEISADYETQRSDSQTLIDHLLWQMELTSFSEQDKAIALAIIDAVNNDGYLSMPLSDIHEGLLDQLEDLEEDEVTAVLHRVQNFDPPGVAALDLGDCLRIQLQQMPDTTPWRNEAIKLVTQHLQYLAAQDQARLLKQLSLTQDELAEVISLIRTLDPRPGRQIAETDSQYVIPDVFVSKKENQWGVTLNPDIAPKLRVNPFYSGMIKRADNSADNTCMKNHLQEARWFLKSLQSRSDTLLKVARCIVEHQEAFLENGPVSMKPLVLRDVADAVGMHESTISRVTTQKYMHTPMGIFEFKYFFSSHVSTTTGGECSATAIRAIIKTLVENENTAKPLSDNKISSILQEKGINVARRTVAKYRESMSIPPSSQRKRII